MKSWGKYVPWQVVQRLLQNGVKVLCHCLAAEGGYGMAGGGGNGEGGRHGGKDEHEERKRGGSERGRATGEIAHWARWAGHFGTHRLCVVARRIQ